MQDRLTEEQERSYENGIRIFARWIARAYIKDITAKKLATANGSTAVQDGQDTADPELDQSLKTAPPG